ncbi:MAG: M15 family metallopeptidase [Clostridia bacterium]
MMSNKRIFLLMFLTLVLLTSVFYASFAADQGMEEGEQANVAAETPAPALQPIEGILEQASAANAAVLYRGGSLSSAFAHWETCYGHAPKVHKLNKAVTAMLRSVVGRTDDAVPIGRTGIRLKECFEVPMPVKDEILQKDLDYNLHGTIYTDSPLLSVAAEFAPRGDGKGVFAMVTFDPAANVRAYSLVSNFEPLEGNSLDRLIDVSGLSAGRYTFTLSAATSAQSKPITLYTVDVKVERVFPYQLTQNKFDDNYSEALSFFHGDTSKFMFTYSFRNARNLSTQTTWREANLVETSLGRVHVMAAPYFEKANEYIENTYICISVQRQNGEIREGKVIPLKNIMQNCSPYVPRFQSNMEYVSHHTLGTAADVNDHMYPNFNIITNHELIGNEVKSCLEYRGIKVNDQGQQYYDFFYTGTYKAYFNRVPKTLLNYLLYELAFYRAGFQWGYYYETACDAMHFMLSENDYNKHIDSEVGLRKIYSYIDDLPQGVRTTEEALALSVSAAPPTNAALSPESAAVDAAPMPTPDVLIRVPQDDAG